MTLTHVLYEVRDGVATVTLNQPEKRNPLSATMLHDITAALQQAKDDDAVRAVILTGAGDKAFCAGADLSGFGGDATEVEKHLGRGAFVDMFLTMEHLGKPLIGCVNGHALAGGFGLALACDMIVAADTATFGTTEINVGLWPMMIMAIINRQLPPKRCMELFMTGERIGAEQALQWGLVNRVTPQQEVRDAAWTLAQQLATKSPVIMRLGRDAFHAIDGMSFEAALRHLQAQLTLVTLTEDSVEGVTAFLEKRRPDFKGR
ncbi:MAG TPA: enoyl-CoA hydratase-related protein [Candidatus Dormibacteraeota bacterium]|jgi:enoyl-CoA hydratase/carnithine racemase|nr:enoyl-CoA hydratase-related protein [Candidatus Dormibacteraeota bacterium]